jgi:hypothetical protein
MRLRSSCVSRAKHHTVGPASTQTLGLTTNRIWTPLHMKTERSTHRVIKTLAPTDRGAIELARRYGDALICVRHRTDAKGKVRHTTVELLVSSEPIRSRAPRMVFIQTQPHEKPLHSVIKAAGGQWDGKRQLWRLPSRVATILNLRSRVVEA